MKKMGIVLLVITMLLSQSALTFAAQTDPVTIIVNGDRVNGECITKNGRTLAPVRAIAEKLGATVLWDENEQKVTVSKLMNTTAGSNSDLELRNVYLWIGKKTMSINNMFVVELDEPAQTVNGRTVIPVKALCDALEVQVSWNDNTQTVTITSGLSSHGSEAALDDATSKYLDRIEQETNAALDQKEAEDKAAGILSANGYEVSLFVNDFMEDDPYVLVKLKNKSEGTLPTCKMKLLIRDKKTTELKKEVDFDVREMRKRISDTFEDDPEYYMDQEIFLRDIPKNYIDSDQYNYEVRMIK